MIYEQPEVFPQPSQTKHEPAILIFTPHVMQSGASDLTPAIFSKSSIDEPTGELSKGAFSIFTD
jgi:hypothetical protein